MNIFTNWIMQLVWYAQLVINLLLIFWLVWEGYKWKTSASVSDKDTAKKQFVGIIIWIILVNGLIYWYYNFREKAWINNLEEKGNTLLKQDIQTRLNKINQFDSTSNGNSSNSSTFDTTK